MAAVCWAPRARDALLTLPERATARALLDRAARLGDWPRAGLPLADGDGAYRRVLARRAGHTLYYRLASDEAQVLALRATPRRSLWSSLPGLDRGASRPVAEHYLIGLTGNIACGKSTVLAQLAGYGAAVIDADRVVHALQEPGQPVWAAIREHFGPGVLAPDGAIDRRALGAIVFADPAALALLERLTHPAVRARIAALVDASAAPVIAVDAVKLLEGGLADCCDELWVVTCAPEQQLARLMARNGFAEAEARRRIAAQPPVETRLIHADVTIDNSGPLAATRARVREAWGVGRESVGA